MGFHQSRKRRMIAIPAARHLNLLVVRFGHAALF